MTYQTVPTVATGDSWSAAQHNLYIKDNFAALWPYTAQNELSYADSNDALTVLPVGAEYSLLTSNGTTPEWSANKNILGLVAYIYQDAAQRVILNTWTTLNWTEVVLNNANMWVEAYPGNITVPETGIYRINGSIMFDRTDIRRHVTLRLIDPSPIYLDKRDSIGYISTHSSFSYTAKFDSTKTYNFQVFHTGPAGVDVAANIGMFYIGPSL